jgi:predicted RNA-binding Zn-ribbon protein involved in translation (DUF1610 family)
MKDTEQRRLPDEGEDGPLCTQCLAPVDRNAQFCPKCGATIGRYMTLDPMGRIYYYGDSLSRAVSGKPRLLVVIGIWLIFGPHVVVTLVALFALSSPAVVSPHSLVAKLIGVLIILAITAVDVAILWRVTKRHLAQDRKSAPSNLHQLPDETQDRGHTPQA